MGSQRIRHDWATNTFLCSPLSERTFFFLLFFLLCLLRKISIYLCLYTSNFQSELLTNSVYFCLGLFSWLLCVSTISLRSSPFYTPLILQLNTGLLATVFMISPLHWPVSDAAVLFTTTLTYSDWFSSLFCPLLYLLGRVLGNLS